MVRDLVRNCGGELMFDQASPVTEADAGTGPRWAAVARFGGLGDDLICSSVFPGLRARYGRLEVITRPPAGVVYQNNPHIDRLTVWPEKEEPEGNEFYRRMLQLRLAEYDFGVHLSSSCEGTLAYVEAQPQFWWPAHMRRRESARSYLGFVHDICELPHDFAPGFYPTDAETERALDTLARLKANRAGPFIGWQLAGSRIDKKYPGSVQVIVRLLEAGCNVCMFGAPGREFAMARDIENQVAEQVRSTDGLYLMMTTDPSRVNPSACDWPIRRSLTQLQLCDAVVGPDTGPMWAVAMLPMPKVVLLSHASPLNIVHGWRNTVALHASADVKCWPCHQLHDRWETCNKHKDLEAAACIADIPIGAVVAAVRKGLNL
jgi:ADP-heptose:LPS heptosyltransferase